LRTIPPHLKLPAVKLARPQLFLTALAALSVLTAQMIGVNRGFLCDCGGIPRLTQADHCHGPHDHACDTDDHGGHDHDKIDHGPGEPMHEHSVAIEKLVASKASPLFLSKPMPPVMALLDWVNGATVSRTDASPRVHRPPPLAGDVGPSWPEVLSRTIAQLV